MHRVLFLAGAFSYGVSVMWMVSLLLGLTAAAFGGHVMRSLLVLWIVNIFLLIIPRVIAIGITSRSREHRSYGAKGLVVSAFVSFALHTVSAPVLLLGHTVSVLRLVRRSPGQWQPAQRDGRPSMREAFRALRGRIIFGLALIVAVLKPHSADPLFLLTVALPLVLAAPIVTLTGDPRVARWVARSIPLYVSPTVRSSRTLARREQLLSRPRSDGSREPRHALGDGHARRDNRAASVQPQR